MADFWFKHNISKTTATFNSLTAPRKTWVLLWRNRRTAYANNCQFHFNAFISSRWHEFARCGLFWSIPGFRPHVLIFSHHKYFSIELVEYINSKIESSKRFYFVKELLRKSLNDQLIRRRNKKIIQQKFEWQDLRPIFCHETFKKLESIQISQTLICVRLTTTSLTIKQTFLTINKNENQLKN